MTAGRRSVSRRGFLAVTATGLLTAWSSGRPSAQQGQDSLPGTGPSGKLWDPDRAGRPLPPTTARDNDAYLQTIEKRLRCTCGCGLDVYTCRTTDFSCTTSPAMHKRVETLQDAGMNADQIIAQFVKENGESVLMAPPKEGFNLAGYFVPSAMILVAGTLLTLALRRWTRAPAAATAAPALDAAGASPEELARLQHELDEIDV